MMESASESNEGNNGVAAASTNNNDNNAGRGADVILVQRYRCLERNVIAALCNAAQEPGETITMTANLMHYAIF